MKEPPSFSQRLLYTDERCKRLNAAFQEEEGLDGCYIWRIQEKDSRRSDDDRYILVLQDMMVLPVYDWEIDLLDDKELVSYLDVKVKQDELTTTVSIVRKLAALLFVVSLGFIPFWDIYMPVTAEVLGVALLFFIISVILFYSVSRSIKTRKRKLDIERAEKDPFYRSALRKLAGSFNLPRKYIHHFTTRIKYIEDEGNVTILNE